MTTTTTPHQPIERKSRMPSRRDFEIFRMSEIMGLTHAEIALTSVKLTRRRISQIVARVRRWLSLRPCQDPRLASELQRKQLARHVERMHLEHVISKARDELNYGQKELTTTTKKDDGTTSTTVRQQPFNIQVLKTYLRAVQALAKLQQQPDVNIPTREECQFPWLEGAINEVYDKWNDKIWSGKLKPQGIYDFVDEIVAAVLKAAATQARSASEGLGCENASDSSNDAVRRESPDPANPPTEDLAPAIESVGRAVPTTQALSASEGNVLPTATPPDVADVPSAGLSFVRCPSSLPPAASLVSQRETPASQLTNNSVDAATPWPAETSTSSKVLKTELSTTAPSQENPKREMPPPSFSPSLLPSVTPFPAPCPSPPS